MLVLSRKPGQVLVLDIPSLPEPIEIRILSVMGNSVRVGIDAPRDVAVHREEIYQRIQNERRKP